MLSSDLQHRAKTVAWALLAVTVLSACGATSSERGAEPASADNNPPQFVWQEGVPGHAVEADALARIAAGTAEGGVPVEVDEIHQVVAAGSRLALFAAPPKNGATNVCFAARIDGAMTAFQCPPAVSDEALLVRVAAGGSTPNTTEWIALVGVARHDVERVEIRSLTGITRSLALHQWRAFSDSLRAIGDPPTELRAYDVAGKLLDTVELGSHSAPCPTGVFDDC